MHPPVQPMGRMNILSESRPESRQPNRVQRPVMIPVISGALCGKAP